MNWLNLHTQTLDSPELIGSEPVDRATWLFLLRYCIGQENAGCIAVCREWGDRKWQQLVRVTLKEVLRTSDLWHWDGDNLIVWGYPAEKETEVLTKRATAKTNGAKGGRPRKTGDVSPEYPMSESHGKPTLVISGKAEGEGEWKEKDNEKIKRESAGGSFDSGPRRPTLSQAKSSAASIGVTSEKADEWWHAREASGWIKGASGGGTMPVGTNWQADLKTYASRGSSAPPSLRSGSRPPTPQFKGIQEDIEIPFHQPTSQVV